MKTIINLTLTSLLTLNSYSIFGVELSLTPNNQLAQPGSSVMLDLIATDLGNGAAPSIGGFDVDLRYDSSVLNLDSYAISADLGSYLDFSFGNLGSIIDIAASSLETSSALHLLQGSEVTLATLDFTVLSLMPGDSTQVNIDSTDPFIRISDGNGIALALDNTHNAVISAVSPSSVPEPGLALILLFALPYSLLYLPNKE